MTATSRGFVQLLTILVVVLSANGVYAQGYKLTIDLLPILPAYCPYTRGIGEQVPNGSNPQAIMRWERLMGASNFSHIHHYCVGLAVTHHALFKARTKQERDGYLEGSIKEFDYVLRLATPDFVLLPEILTKRGENLVRLGKAPQAIPNLMRAIDIKPDYWPPYAALSDLYKEAGDIESARTWLEQGLAASPDAKPLRERLNKVSRAPGK